MIFIQKIYRYLLFKKYNKLTRYNQVFSGYPVSSTNNTDSHDTTEILLKVALNTIIPIVHNI